MTNILWILAFFLRLLFLCQYDCNRNKLSVSEGQALNSEPYPACSLHVRLGSTRVCSVRVICAQTQLY